MSLSILIFILLTKFFRCYYDAPPTLSLTNASYGWFFIKTMATIPQHRSEVYHHAQRTYRYFLCILYFCYLFTYGTEIGTMVGSYYYHHNRMMMGNQHNGMNQTKKGL